MAESKTSEKGLTTVQKQKRALELRAKGHGFDHIAGELGYKGPSGAYQAVMAGLKKTLQEPADELRKLEGERLDKLLNGLWEKAEDGHLWAVDRALNIMERRAKLYGLDSPPSDETGRMAQAFLEGVEHIRTQQAEDLSE